MANRKGRAPIFPPFVMDQILTCLDRGQKSSDVRAIFAPEMPAQRFHELVRNARNRRKKAEAANG